MPCLLLDTTSRICVHKGNSPHKDIILDHQDGLKLTRRAPLMEHELLTLPERLSSPPLLSGVCVTRSLVLCPCFVDRCLSLCRFSFGHYNVV